MQFDFVSMAVLIGLHLAVVGTVLPWVMGHPVSQAARHAQKYFLLQAMGWGFILFSGHVKDYHSAQALMSFTATCAVSAAQWQMGQALTNWLGQRPLRKWLLGVCLLGPLGFAILIDSVTWRMAWFSTCHALSMVMLGRMCLQPLRPTARAWRFLMAGCATVMALILLARVYMVAYTPWLESFTQDTLANHVFAIIAHFCGSLTLVSLLVAWRDETNQKLRDLAMTDQLTGLSNRHSLLQTAPLMLAMARRQSLPLAVLLLDLDHFKDVNDKHGHATGDQALQLIGDVLRSQVRADEMAARWGGEEFCVLMYAQPDAVMHFYQRLSMMLQERSSKELGLSLQISAGCTLQDASYSLDLQQLMQKADLALYQAKYEGRNKLIFYEVGLASAAAPPQALLEPA